MSNLSTIEVEPLKQESSALVLQARALAVTDAPSYTAAAEFLRGVKTLSKKIEATLEPAVVAAHQAHKAAVAVREQLLQGPKEAEAAVKQKMGVYQAEQDRIRRAEEQRRQEQARAEAEERRIADAVRLEAAGRVEEAEKLIEAPVYVPPVVLTSSVPTVAGVSAREVWKFRVDDEALVPREYLMVDEKKVGAYARSFRNAAKIPGITFYADTSISASGF